MSLVQAAVSADQTTLSPDSLLALVLLDVAIILVAARLLGGLASRTGQPRVVGEIVAGVVLGPALLGGTSFLWAHGWNVACPGLVGHDAPRSFIACFFPPETRSVLAVLGQVALIVFMFLVGLEMDWTLLEGRRRDVLYVAAGVVAVPMAVGVVIAPALYSARFVPSFATADAPTKLAFSLTIGAMLSATALPVLAHILEERNLTRTRLGSVSIVVAAAATIFTFLTMALALEVARDGHRHHPGWRIAAAAAFLAVLVFAIRPALRPLGRRCDRNGSVGPPLLAGIVILVLVAAFAAARVGLHPIIGSFVVGAVLPARPLLSREFHVRLWDVTTVVLLPVFLAFSGLSTEMTRLDAHVAGGIALLLGAGVVSKWLGGTVFARMGGLTWAEGCVLSTLMGSGMMVLVVGLVAAEGGIISTALQMGGVLLALVTTMMTGPLLSALVPRTFSPGGATPLAAPMGSGPPTAMSMTSMSMQGRHPIPSGWAERLRRPALSSSDAAPTDHTTAVGKE